MVHQTTTPEARKLAKIWHGVKTSGKAYNKANFQKKGGAQGGRLWDVLKVATRYNKVLNCHPTIFVQEKDSRGVMFYKSNWPEHWDEDDMANFIQESVFEQASELGIAILKNRGRIPGKSPAKKPKPVVQEPETQEPVLQPEVLAEPSSQVVDNDLSEKAALEIAQAILTLQKYNLHGNITF